MVTGIGSSVEPSLSLTTGDNEGLMLVSSAAAVARAEEAAGILSLSKLSPPFTKKKQKKDKTNAY